MNGLETLVGVLEANILAEKRWTLLFWWVMTFFRERYGSFGVDLLGGTDQVMRL
jgi:hypothetical protein